ncbi:dihydrolipoamide acetyltransferase family protein [Albidovulum sediminicola]|uniref:Dihydrolipoamide acetyltransferase component of pyruvate dehydrogenase complex n=1 Tax=Albidovulum sediminicola TaxID=2984331 RepID=A0ABT2Z1R5_9RHOB|nr:dihydrolipoamide acetyltransferase family protein [Defluviimonas sp. WL0075]MCV2865061.1 2-oxo acid dehydrogenase subunit E2 [Defluviimonas sp. WL0075]
MSAFLMPSLGADMEAGTLIEQLVPTGGEVHRGDIIAVVETQKGAIEIEVFQDGRLEGWLVGVGQKVPVGTPLAMIRAAGEPEAPQPQDPAPEPPAPEVPPPAEPGPPSTEPEVPPPDIPSPEQPYPELRRPRASPAARRLAARRGIDLSRLAPRRDGTIRLADVDAAAGAPPAPDMRQAIAAAMARSKREIPHYYLSHQLDVTAVLDFVAQRNADRPPEARLVPAALYLRAMARALDKYPEFAGHYIGGRFRPAGGAHIGLAINLRGRGLVAPAIFDVDRSDIDAVMAAVRDLVQRARAGRFRARELSDATITLTSLGERGVDGLFGIIYPPQVAIVGIGTPAPRPCVVAGQVVARTMATLTLAADHRVSDGHRGALFLRAIDTHLQQPEAL